MNFRKSRKSEPDVNLTPLIDVVFLLLIFFMVSTTFLKESEIQIALPTASTEVLEKNSEIIEIVINSDGQFFVNQQRVINTQMKTLKKAVETVLAEGEKRPMVISADANTPHQSVVTAMDVAKQLGITQLSLATQHLSP